MANITVQQRFSEAPRVRVLTVNSGARFIAIDLGKYTTFTLPGHDAEAVASARELAHALLDAANQIEDALAVQHEAVLARTDRVIAAIEALEE